LGAFTLTGHSGDLIELRSTIDGTWWNIDPQGSRNVSYVNVKDSNNVNLIVINANNSLDSGHNVNWFFDVETIITDTEIEEATQIVDDISDIGVEIADATLQVTDLNSPEPELISLSTGESLVSSTDSSGAEEPSQQQIIAVQESDSETSAGTAEAGFDYDNLNYEEGERKFKKHYARGKYKTVVILFEGKVVMTPYDTQGPKEEDTVILLPGQNAIQKGEVN